MTNSVEICKQLSSSSFINVKLKSKKISSGNFLSVQLLRINANCVSVVVLQLKWCSMLRLFRVSTRKIKTANYKSFLAFSVLVVLFLNFREIEPTVSYKLFLMKKMRLVIENAITSW